MDDLFFSLASSLSLCIRIFFFSLFYFIIPFCKNTHHKSRPNFFQAKGGKCRAAKVIEAREGGWLFIRKLCVCVWPNARTSSDTHVSMKAQRVKREKGWKKKWILFRNKFSSSFQSGRCWMKVLLFTLFFFFFFWGETTFYFSIKKRFFGI